MVSWPSDLTFFSILSKMRSRGFMFHCFNVFLNNLMIIDFKFSLVSWFLGFMHSLKICAYCSKVYFSILHYITVYWSVLQNITVHCKMLNYISEYWITLSYIVIYIAINCCTPTILLQFTLQYYNKVHGRKLQNIAAYRSIMQ